MIFILLITSLYCYWIIEYIRLITFSNIYFMDKGTHQIEAILHLFTNSYCYPYPEVLMLSSLSQSHPVLVICYSKFSHSFCSLYPWVLKLNHLNTKSIVLNILIHGLLLESLMGKPGPEVGCLCSVLPMLSCTELNRTLVECLLNQQVQPHR